MIHMSNNDSRIVVENVTRGGDSWGADFFNDKSHMVSKKDWARDVRVSQSATGTGSSKTGCDIRDSGGTGVDSGTVVSTN